MNSIKRSVEWFVKQRVSYAATRHTSPIKIRLSGEITSARLRISAR